MLADRLSARLAGLDHEALLSYAAELSFSHRHTADVLLAKHSPLPAWARDEVLLSADLLPYVFATLQMEDNAAASVCQALCEAPPGAARAALLERLAPAIAAEGRLAQRLLDAPHLAGNIWHADHKVAVADGGGECTVDNMQVLCVACHLEKTRRESRERRTRRGRQAMPAAAAGTATAAVDGAPLESGPAVRSVYFHVG